MVPDNHLEWLEFWLGTKKEATQTTSLIQSSLIVNRGSKYRIEPYLNSIAITVGGQRLWVIS
jgi:hypothetical protein